MTLSEFFMTFGAYFMKGISKVRLEFCR